MLLEVHKQRRNVLETCALVNSLHCSLSFQYAKMILPHVGLVVLLIVYLLFGATVFHYLEWDNEKEV